jgi:hypothetical protein
MQAALLEYPGRSDFEQKIVISTCVSFHRVTELWMIKVKQ